jgi:uncharacterized membrane protein YqjE
MAAKALNARDGSPNAAGGLLAALRSFGTTLAQAAGIRGRLFAVELQEEIERRKILLALGALAFIFLHTAFVLATAVVAVAFWETHRLAALAAMAIAYGALGTTALAVLHRRVATAPAPFSATRAELERDLGLPPNAL